MPPSRRYRKTSMDHVADALLHLEEAEAALARIEMDKIGDRGRAAVEALRRCVLEARTSCADAIDAVLGRPPREEPPTPTPTVTRPRRRPDRSGPS